MADVVAKGGTTVYVGPERVTAFIDAKGDNMSGTLDPKDPLETKNYSIDVTSWMDALGVTIADLTFVSGSGGISADGNLSGATVIVASVQGGVAGTVGKVRIGFSTTDGQNLVASMFIPIKDK